jgi:hypothetical protein
MFARRHYRIIAAIIADLSLSDDEHDDLGLIEIEALRESVARQFANALAVNNPAFNRAVFLSACMAKEKPRVMQLPQGVQLGLGDPRALHEAIAKATGEED